MILEFQLKANPAPTVTWTLNSNPITSGGRISTNLIEKSGIYTVSMEISHVTSADQGKYQAVVKNVRGKATATFTVNMQGNVKNWSS